jgi:hypothetical protein
MPSSRWSDPASAESSRSQRKGETKLLALCTITIDTTNFSARRHKLVPTPSIPFAMVPAYTVPAAIVPTKNYPRANLNLLRFLRISIAPVTILPSVMVPIHSASSKVFCWLHHGVGLTSYLEFIDPTLSGPLQKKHVCLLIKSISISISFD